MRHFFLPILLFCVLFSSCLKDDCTETQRYTIYTPVYKQADELRQGIGMEAARPLVQPGKIYVYGHLLLINEMDKGIHLINNSNPANPINTGFLAIPGNRDMAMYSGVLYADNYMDLLAFDFSNFATPELVTRHKNVFNMFKETNKGVIIDYLERDTMVQVSCFNNNGILIDFFDANSDGGSWAGPATQAPGIGGSTARITIMQGHLYAVDEQKLYTYNLDQPTTPLQVSNVNIGWDIETIWPYGDKLFIGSMSGMYIYDCSQPASPYQLSAFQHARACDPVVTDGRYAYVTLRSGTFCDGFANQMDVVDIQNLTNPKLLHTYPQTHPIGLSVKGDILYICDDQDGLKVYNKSDVATIDKHLLAHHKGFQAVDVIALPYNDLILVIGEDGLVQYNAADPVNLQLVSKIAVN